MFMNIEEKAAFEKVLGKMKEDKGLWNSGGENRFTVSNLALLAQGLLFDKMYKMYGITKHQMDLIITYFKTYEEELYTKDLLKEFPGVFER
jgi:hypothetical protein